MDMRIQPLRIKIMFESNPLKAIMLVRRFAASNLVCHISEAGFSFLLFGIGTREYHEFVVHLRAL